MQSDHNDRQNGYKKMQNNYKETEKDCGRTQKWPQRDAKQQRREAKLPRTQNDHQGRQNESIEMQNDYKEACALSFVVLVSCCSVGGSGSFYVCVLSYNLPVAADYVELQISAIDLLHWMYNKVILLFLSLPRDSHIFTHFTNANACTFNTVLPSCPPPSKVSKPAPGVT